MKKFLLVAMLVSLFSATTVFGEEIEQRENEIVETCEDVEAEDSLRSQFERISIESPESIEETDEDGVYIIDNGDSGFVVIEGAGGLTENIADGTLADAGNLNTDNIHYEDGEFFYYQLDDDSKYIYNELYDIYKDGYDTKSHEIDTSGLSKNTLKNINSVLTPLFTTSVDSLVYDHPELSWLTYCGTFYMGWSRDYSGTVTVNFQYSASARIDTKANMEKAVAAAKADLDKILDGDTTDYNVVSAIHKYLVETITYDYVSGNSGSACNHDLCQTAYSGLADTVTYNGKLSRRTVCAGYSRAFKVLCDLYGVPCLLVEGSAGGAHMWNAVCVQGDWYLMDVTWDDAPYTSSGIIYTYYLAGTNTFSDHVQNKLTNGYCYIDGHYYGYAYPEFSTTDFDPSKIVTVEKKDGNSLVLKPAAESTLSEASIKITADGATYDGKSHAASIECSENITDFLEAAPTDSDIVYYRGTAKTEDLVSAGTITATYTYKNTKISVDYVIKKAELSESLFEAIDDQNYTGQIIKPTVKAKLNTLLSSTDYQVSYGTSVISPGEKGTVTITATANSNFTGTVELTYNVIIQKLSDAVEFTYAGTKATDSEWFKGDVTVTLTGYKLSYTFGSGYTDKITISKEGKDITEELYVKDAKGVLYDKVKTEPVSIDKTAPVFSKDQGMEIFSKVYNTLSDTTNFSLLKDENITVNMTAEDSLSGVATVSIFVDKEATKNTLSKSDLLVKTFNDFEYGTAVNLTGVEAKNHIVCYGYVTDKAGNVSDFVCSDGFVIREHDPAEEVIENKVPSTVEKEGSLEKVVYCKICHEELSRVKEVIEKKKVKAVSLEFTDGSNGQYEYTGGAIVPQFKVSFGDDVLLENRDYTVKISNNTKVANAYSAKRPTITITGKRNLIQKKEFYFDIYENNLSKAYAVEKGIPKLSAKFDNRKIVYTGEDLTEELKSLVLSVNGGQVKNLSDEYYDVIVPEKVVNAGKYMIKVVPKTEEYTGSVSKVVTVAPYEVAKNSPLVSVEKFDAVNYNPAGAVPTISENSVTLDLNGNNVNLVEGRDYTLKFSNNTKVSTDKQRAKVTFTLKGNYKGTVTAEYIIKRQSLKDALVVMPDITNYKNGKYTLTKPYVNVDGFLVKNSEYVVTAYTSSKRDEASLISKNNPYDIRNGNKIYIKIAAKRDKNNMECGNYTGEINDVIAYVYSSANVQRNLSSSSVIIKKLDEYGMEYVIKDVAYSSEELTKDMLEQLDISFMVNDKLGEISCEYYDVKIFNNLNKGKATVVICAKDNSEGIHGCKAINLTISGYDARY